MARVLVRVYHFNSHLREETNKNSISPQQNKKIFQLTSPRGDKPDDKFCLMPYLSFQLASPWGDERGLPSRAQPWQEISTHVSFRRRTRSLLVRAGYIHISTHVSFRRRTLRPVHPWDRMNISIHVSARRRTAIQHLFPAPENISTHVSARRRTVCHLSCGIRAATFQFTSL